MSRVLPILFNTDMVRAILDGKKTVTRRKVKFLENRNPAWTGYIKDGLMLYNGSNELCCKKPPCHVGDILYVQEEWFYECHMEDLTTGKPDLPSGRYSHRYIYQADDSDYPVSVGVGGTGWQSPETMPKEAARIWLKVKDIRVDRLQDITIDEVIKEGCADLWVDEAKSMRLLDAAGNKNQFTDIWNSTIKKADQDLYGWDANPWVWVIEFEKCDKPEE